MLKVVLIGQLIINIPVVLIILFIAIILNAYNVSFNLGIIIGITIGWIYWKFAVKIWWKWAIGKVDEAKLTKWAKITLIKWW